MVAPAIIAGIGALGGVILGAVLGKKKTVYAVTFISRGCVCGKTFDDLPSAERWQDTLAQKGHGSIIVANEAGEYKGLRAVRAVAAGGKKVKPDQLRRMGVGARDFDTNEEALEVTQATTRLPTPEWARRARFGPYPETNPGKEDRLPVTPLFDETTSSHEWKSDVKTWDVPGKYFPGGQGMSSQPDELVVEQALQFPEDQANRGA